jgi:hypothetical protein
MLEYDFEIAYCLKYLIITQSAYHFFIYFSLDFIEAIFDNDLGGYCQGI